MAASTNSQAPPGSAAGGAAIGALALAPARAGGGGDARRLAAARAPRAVLMPGGAGRQPTGGLTGKARRDAALCNHLQRAAGDGRLVASRRQNAPPVSAPAEAAVAHVHAHRHASGRQRMAAPYRAPGAVATTTTWPAAAPPGSTRVGLPWLFITRQRRQSEWRLHIRPEWRSL